MTKLKIAMALAPLVCLLGGTPALAAEEDSWLCKYFPKYCASEGDPGGLPGHSNTNESVGDETSRGMGNDKAEPEVKKPEPESSEPTPPPEKGQEKK